MKSNNFLIIAGLSLFLNVNVFADNFRLPEETSVNDIPFDTYEVFYKLMVNDTNNLYLPHLEEEAAVNDIPFDTERIAATQLGIRAESIRFDMLEETEVLDIPFNTRAIAKQNTRPASFISNRFLVLIGQCSY